MNAAIFDIPESWHTPRGIQRLHEAAEVSVRCWDLLAVSHKGCEELADRALSCRILLLPGDCCPHRIRAEAVITYGLSPRDSVTLSGIAQPVLCVQRTLPGMDGREIEPQEIPLRAAADPEELLLLGTLWLLCGGEGDRLYL